MFLTLPAAVIHVVIYVFAREIRYLYLHIIGDILLLGAMACIVGGCIVAIGYILKDIKKHQRSTKSTFTSEEEKGL
jgi:hypothetical protein